MTNNENQEEIDNLEAALQTAEGKTSANFEALIQALLSDKQYEKARLLLNNALTEQETIEPNDVAFCKASLGFISIIDEDIDAAFKYLNEALQQTNETEELYAKIQFRLGLCYSSEKKLEEAITHYIASIDWGNDNDKPSAEGYFNLAITYLEMEAMGEAIECLQNALEINEEYGSTIPASDILLQIGDVQAYQQNWKEALSNYHYASEYQEDNEDPSLGKTYYKMVQVLMNMDKFSTAINYYEKSVPLIVNDLTPDRQSDLHFQLANLYVDYKDDFSKALEHYKAAKDYLANETEQDEVYQMNLEKLNDSIAQMEEKVNKAAAKPKAKKGFFKRLFG